MKSHRCQTSELHKSLVPHGLPSVTQRANGPLEEGMPGMSHYQPAWIGQRNITNFSKISRIKLLNYKHYVTPHLFIYTSFPGSAVLVSLNSSLAQWRL